MFKKRVFTLFLAVTVFSLVFFATPPQVAKAVSCSWGGVNQIEITATDLMYGSVLPADVAKTIKGLRSIRGYVTQVDINKFVSQSGVVILDTLKDQRQNLYTYLLSNNDDLLMTVSVSIVPNVPNRAFWFFTQAGANSPCLALETSSRLATEVYTSFIKLVS